jgi:hypothetical protein
MLRSPGLGVSSMPFANRVELTVMMLLLLTVHAALFTLVAEPLQPALLTDVGFWL